VVVEGWGKSLSDVKDRGHAVNTVNTVKSPEKSDVDANSASTTGRKQKTLLTLIKFAVILNTARI